MLTGMSLITSEDQNAVSQTLTKKRETEELCGFLIVKLEKNIQRTNQRSKYLKIKAKHTPNIENLGR